MFSCRTIGFGGVAGSDAEELEPGVGPTMIGNRTEAGIAGNADGAGAGVDVVSADAGVGVDVDADALPLTDAICDTAPNVGVGAPEGFDVNKGACRVLDSRLIGVGVDELDRFVIVDELRAAFAFGMSGAEVRGGGKGAPLRSW